MISSTNSTLEMESAGDGTRLSLRKEIKEYEDSNKKKESLEEILGRIHNVLKEMREVPLVSTAWVVQEGEKQAVN